MPSFEIANRPFATHPMTGLMMPDGIFETALGPQELHAQVRNTTAGALAGTRIYLESVSDPGIAVSPRTYDLGDLPSDAVRTLSWKLDLTDAAPGDHYVSFVSNGPSGTTRVIKKIFVMRTTFDPVTHTFDVDVPQGRLNVEFVSLFAAAEPCVKPSVRSDRAGTADLVAALGDDERSFLDAARELYSQHYTDFVFCPPGYLPKEVRLTLSPNPPYSGQYGPLPFEDPFWKIILGIVAGVLVVAAAIVEAVAGTGEIQTTTGPANDGSCCNTEAEGEGTNAVAAGLVAAAATVATIAAASDARDPMRRGQDHTPPPGGEVTTGENLKFELVPNDPVALGRPFQVDTRWEYRRTTDGGTYSHSVSETQENQHVLSRYDISAPDVLDNTAGETFEVKAEFYDADGHQLRGGRLFVQCFLIAPSGRYYRTTLADDGAAPDSAPDDGTYTGGFPHLSREMEAGTWSYFVIAQDVNDADPGMDPDQAAQIIGGMVVTHQLTIGFSGGTCPLVPDGQVDVVG